MEVLGYCRKCNVGFDAHWHNYPELKTSEAIVKPYCPKCKGYDIGISTDESYQEEYEDDITEFDEED